MSDSELTMERLAAAKKLLEALEHNDSITKQFSEEEVELLKEMISYVMGIRAIAKTASALKRVISYVGWAAGAYAAWRLGWTHGFPVGGNQ